MQIKLQLGADSATPAFRNLVFALQPARFAEALRDPLLKLVRDNYEAQPPNKWGAPSTGYWHSAAANTYGVTGDHGVTLVTDKIGVRQHFLGGPIYPINARLLSIPACAETHGKTPRDFTGLVVTVLPSEQYALLALIKSSDLDFVRDPRNRLRAASKAMFWLASRVNQVPEPDVIPSDKEFNDIIDRTLHELLRTN